MEELRDLNQMALNASNRFSVYDGKDFVLPQLFKDKVKEINSNTIVYNQFSAVIETKGYQNGTLNIYMPNQWFYVASYFTDLYCELMKYKRFALQVTTKERLKILNDSSLNEEEIATLQSLDLSLESKEKLARFITDYTWWGGAKTIDRGDFYVSPILSHAKLVNASQSFVADLCAFLSDKKDLVDVILNSEYIPMAGTSQNSQSSSLQQIFYGAPGTGKSNTIRRVVDEQKKISFRTTFHPDSDYSTFVGAYKPTMKESTITKDGVTTKEEKIIYTFCPQAFTNAYVEAWNTDEEVYLIIEEINRGNCAQIFGDLFQLLDRDDNGESEYPVEADADLQSYLQKELANTTRTDIPEDVKSGKILKLPSNLYIWATMNTSDQSLFPIDSAFKRRWEWVYMPIADAKKNYVIEIDNDQYDWWSFLEAINAIIESTTHSEDKKLGYFFAKAKGGRISVETFVSKVIFYLWNDVFKDNETNHKAFKDSDGELLPFRKFFLHDGTVDTNVVIKFLQDLEVYPFETSDDGTAAVSDTTPNTKRQRDKSRYRVNGTDNLNKAQMTREAFRLYIEAHPDADAQAIEQAWNGLGLENYVRHLVETEDEYNARTKNSTDSNKRATEFELSNGEKIYLSTQFGIGNIGKFMDAVNNAGWNIRIENQA